MSGKHIQWQQLFSTHEYDEFSLSKTHNYFRGDDRPMLEYGRVLVEKQKSTTKHMLSFLVKIPFAGNPKWFSVYYKDKPFVANGISDPLMYSISYDEHNQAYIEVTVTGLPEQFSEQQDGQPWANKVVATIKEYIGPRNPPLAQLLDQLRANRP